MPKFCKDEVKISLKSIPVKLLVLAYYAQFWVSAGNERNCGRYVMAYINRPTFSRRPRLVDFLKIYDLGWNLFLVKAWNSVAWLEWKYGDRDNSLQGVHLSKFEYRYLKLLLQKSLINSSNVSWGKLLECIEK